MEIFLHFYGGFIFACLLDFSLWNYVYNNNRAISKGVKMDNYISIKEFAANNKISLQEAITIVLNNPDRYTTKHIDNKLFILSSNSTDNTSLNNTKIDNENTIISFLINQIELLQAELKEKNNIIAENNNKLSSLLEEQQTISKQALDAIHKSYYIQAMQLSKKKGFFQRLFQKDNG